MQVQTYNHICVLFRNVQRSASIELNFETKYNLLQKSNIFKRDYTYNQNLGKAPMVFMKFSLQGIKGGSIYLAKTQF